MRNIGINYIVASILIGVLVNVLVGLIINKIQNDKSRGDIKCN
jgi:hypothetical protein